MGEVAKLGITENGIEYVKNCLQEKQKAGKLAFPKNYSYSNSLTSAFFMLKQAENKDHKPLLEVCTQESIYNSLMSMATQGLNPIKNQCYFVAMGNKCTLLPSYFGTLSIAKRVADLVADPIANVIYEGDVFEYNFDVLTGEKKIVKHEQKLENIDLSKIKGAYAIIRTKEQTIVEIMNIQQIKNSWGMGYAKGNSKAHNMFADEMCKKTVLSRACKLLINSSDDSSIMSDEMIETVNQDDTVIDVTSHEVHEEITEKANQKEFVVESKKEVVDKPEVDPGF